MYLIAHDLGTSGDKATLFTVEGELVRSATHPYGVRFFNGNWAEQNPLDWWEAFCHTNRRLLEGIDAARVLAVSFSGQMMGCLCVDREGQPLRDAIIWADMRATEQAAQLEARIDPRAFYRLTGHRISSSYSAEKLMWVRDNQPELYRQTHKFLNAKDYIIQRLTGRFVTDYSDASGTNLFDINAFCWSDHLVELTGIDPGMLPEALPATEVVGEVPASLSGECGLPAGTPVVIGGGDGMCASVGAGSVAPGRVYNCLGTSSWVCTAAEKPIFDEEMRTFNWAHVVPGLVGPCGTMQAAGMSYNWAAATLYSEEMRAAARNAAVYQLVDREIEDSPPLARGLLFLPYLLGERSPRWNPNARGAFVGLSGEHTRGDMMRSVVEGVAMNLRVILDIFREHEEIGELTVIGGLAKGGIVRRILADVLDADILMPDRVEEATSIGAAVTAGVGVGAIGGFGEVARFARITSRTRPVPEQVAQYRRMAPVFEQTYRSLLGVFDGLAALRGESV